MHSRCTVFHVLSFFLISMMVIWMPLLAEEVHDYGAKVAPDLAAQMSTLDQGELVKVMISFTDRVDTRQLAAQFDTRQARHTAVVTSLQTKAEVAQSGTLHQLEELKQLGLVERYAGYWLGNLVFADLLPEAVAELAKRNDIEMIAPNYDIELIEPIGKPQPMPMAPGAAESGLIECNVRPMWAMGYDGSGVLVMNFDTGVDGNHPALAGRWHGNAAPWEEAWRDVDNFADDFPDDQNGHGTHTMGTIAGLDPVTQDTIGMAPGASWMAAGSPLLISGALEDAIIAFEWAADPDGDPNTSDDVPVVCSNSWGTGTVFGEPPCYDAYDAAIIDLENAGCAVVFAAGNEGFGGIRAPATRINSPLQVFAVGSLEEGSNTISSFSSRGPSDCTGTDEERIKPEVSARGSNVRSAYFGGYANLSGTSMATPHVAGAIAVLSQAFPNATPDELKSALYESAFDLGAAGEDNDFGRGRIDVLAAYQWLLANSVGVTISLAIDAQYDPVPVAGDTFPMQMTMTNLDSFPNSFELWINMTFPDGRVIPALGHKFPNLAALSSTTKSPQVRVRGAGPSGKYTLTAFWVLGGDTASSQTSFTKQAPPCAFDLSATSFDFTVAAGGTASDVLTISNTGLEGFDYSIGLSAVDLGGAIRKINPDELQMRSIEDGGTSHPLLGAINTVEVKPLKAEQIHPRIHALAATNDVLIIGDGGTEVVMESILIAAGYNVTTVSDDVVYDGSNPAPDDFGTVIVTDGVSYGGDMPASGQQALVDYLNNGGGLVAIEWVEWENTQGRYQILSPALPLTRTSGSTGLDSYTVVGTHPVTDGVSSSFTVNTGTNVGTAVAGTVVVTGSISGDAVVVEELLSGGKIVQFACAGNYTGLDPFAESDMQLLLTNAVGWATNAKGWISPDPRSGTIAAGANQAVTIDIDAAELEPGSYACDMIVSCPDQTDTVSVTLTVTAAAQGKGIAGNLIGTGAIPRTTALLQNYPNPFNPSTDFEFQLADFGVVQISIYDVQGRLVRTVLNQEMAAGSYSASWNGRSDTGSSVASGVYIYRMTVGSFTQTRKMMLLK